MITIENNRLSVSINELGAQLHSIKRLPDQTEYLWQGSPDSWERQAPVLFPFVGKLKDDQYTYQGQTYHQGQHGFARDMVFAVTKQSDHAVTFQLKDNEQTRQVYPFAFELNISYRLVDDQLLVNYLVVNPSQDQTLIYALGAHPGFRTPLSDTSNFEDVEISTEPVEELDRFKLVGPYNDRQHPFKMDMHQPIMANHDLFYEDAIIFETHGEPFAVNLTDTKTQHGVKVSVIDTPYVGVWSAYPKLGNFICIEPWWGVADAVDADGRLEDKDAMHRLIPQDSDTYSFSIKPF
ncbi:aldose 1-epimerase family protein [uncultured Limosilactobacillus sp.]|uniref:aldose 1-epimerase family protein n=1 Tax=uncultured Limosilactobacillus sp. TaxID=2837629 RepID=UPI0025D9B824|nr:aldose 1-epimerase family protein [uncultured Limosilactobacillus sp.]